LKDFDKGNGVEFLDKLVGLNLANVNNLVCGDTGSDFPMATASVKHAGKDKTWAVFVTKNEGLK
jgi:hydroxymethylpyrimidine pyrophosphatase-like HAD family hydrolase